MKKIFMFMLTALTLAVIPSCEYGGEKEPDYEYQEVGLALATGTYVGSIDFGTSKGSTILLNNAEVVVMAYDDNSVDISVPSVRSESYSIEDLFFDLDEVEETQPEVWSFSNDTEVVVNGTVMDAKISGNLTPSTNQMKITISISGIGTLNFKGRK